MDPDPTELLLRLAPVLAAIVAFLLALLPQFINRKRQRKAHREALLAEINVCERHARIYLRDGVAAPLYRLPTIAFEKSFPHLLGDGVFGRQAVEDLEDFALMIEAINRGLDNAHAARDKHDGHRLLEEVGRNQSKCRDLLESHGPNKEFEAYVTRARRAVMGV
jgi:hypothetical protein